MCIIFVLAGLHSCVTVHVTLPMIVRDAMHIRDQTAGTSFHCSCVLVLPVVITVLCVVFAVC